MIDFDKKPFESLGLVVMSLLVVGLVIYGICDHIDKNRTPVERAAHGTPLGLKAIAANYDGKYIIERHDDSYVLGISNYKEKTEDMQYVRVDERWYNKLIETAAINKDKDSLKIDVAALEKSLPPKSEFWSWVEEHPGISAFLALVAFLIMLRILAEIFG